MNCPNCGVYNPEDREVCWRCDKPLPKPTPQKRRNPQQAARTWLYVAVAVFMIITLLQMCGIKLPFGVQTTTPQPGSYLGPQGPAVVYQVESPWYF